MSKNETNWDSYFKLPNAGLRAYFERVVRGQPDEYRTTFYKGKSVEAILKGWDPYVKGLSSRWPSLVDFENDLRSKVGPLSIMLPLEKRMSDIDSYYESILLDSKPISHDALICVVNEFGSKIGGLRLRSQKRTVDFMKKSTNSGSPYFVKRKDVVHLTYPCWSRHTDLHVYLHLNNSAWDGTAILGWRGQEGGPEYDDVKQRVVWMFPFSVNIEELQLYQPLIEGCQKNGLVPAWISMDAVDQRITDLFDTKQPEDLIVCTDFSKFDQHFNKDMQDAAKTILSDLVSPSSETQRWLDEVFPIKYMIPLAYNWGEVRVGAHGMASGSGGTNADETLTHRALQYEAALAQKQKLNPNSMCLGDDGILSYPGITVSDVVHSYSAHGQEMNLDKQYASKQDCVYLRRWHHKDYRVDNVCVGVYSTYRALGRLAEQERFFSPDIWSKKMVALRQLSIIENCKYHPLREQFADYCMKGDKYRLGIDIPGFLDDIERIAKEATELMPDFLGYVKTMQSDNDADPSKGIENWWIVKYLKKKR